MFTHTTQTRQSFSDFGLHPWSMGNHAVVDDDGHDDNDGHADDYVIMIWRL